MYEHTLAYYQPGIHTLAYTLVHTRMCATLHYITSLHVQSHYVAFHYIKLHYITFALHYITVHYITPHHITFHSISFHYITSYLIAVSSDMIYILYINHDIHTYTQQGAPTEHPIQLALCNAGSRNHS